MKADGVVVEEGDMVCLHTGFGQMLVDGAGNPDPDRLNAFPALDGGDPDLQAWIRASGLSALIADHYAVEHITGLDRSNGGRRAQTSHHDPSLLTPRIHLDETLYLRAP